MNAKKAAKISNSSNLKNEDLIKAIKFLESEILNTCKEGKNKLSFFHLDDIYTNVDISSLIKYFERKGFTVTYSSPYHYIEW